jgi:hypothetical protein
MATATWQPPALPVIRATPGPIAATGSCPAGADAAVASRAIRQASYVPPRVLTGAEAERYVAERRTKNPEMDDALALSETGFIKSGYTRVGVQVYFVRRALPDPKSRLTSVPARLQQWLVPTLHAQDEFFNEGEVYSTAWEDGDETTWDGNLYAVDYVTGGEHSTDAKLYVSESDQGPPAVLSAGGATTVQPFRSARLGTAETVPVAMNNNAGCSCRWRNTWSGCALRQSLDESWPLCASAAAGCLLSSAMYLGCVGGACYGRIFYGYLSTLRETFKNCSNTYGG